jgi:hypothetical protein
MTSTTDERRVATRIDSSVELACAAGGLAAAIFVIGGLMLVGRFIPPQDPAAGAGEVARFYLDNAGAIRIGMIVTMIGFNCFVPYGISLAVLLRAGEPRPVLTYVQIASTTIATLFAVMTTFIWSTAAFRPGELATDATRMLNDLGWFCFLFTIPSFTIWIAAIGVAILRDRRPIPPLPRWSGYLNLWVSIPILPAMAMTFFKTGPFAFNGIMALYLPFSAFFAWILVMTRLMFRAIRRDANL